MTAFDVRRLLQNPLGDPAPPGSRGDIVQISDGTATICLTPAGYDTTDEAQLRYLLARKSAGAG